jgi:transposase
MQDKELYQQLLGINTPWAVNRIELNVAEKRVNVWVGHTEGVKWPCPECQKDLKIYDHAEERAWRHLDSCAFQTYLHARIPRIECADHGILQVRVPWAEPHSRFTMLFERLAVDVLLQCDVTGATRILNISWKEAWHLMERAVARGQRRKEKQVVHRIGVDEKAVAKGHKYMTLVCNLDGGTVEYITEDRKQESLESYYKGLTPKQKEGIEAVAMDMWEPYVQATKAYVEKADDKIVFDRFHIMQHMGKAVDMVRKQENRELLKQGDETLIGSKYLWLYSQENIPEKRKEEFALLKSQQLKVARAWAIKESLRELWHYVYPERAKSFWKRWYFWATHSRLKPVIEVAAMIKRHIANILTYFRHRITNAVSEGINCKIQTIKKMAYGFRNINNFKTAIYFHCGGLNLYPC